MKGNYKIKKFRGQKNDLMKVLNIQDESTKYGNKWVEIDGIRFQSKKEGGYYQFLKAEKPAGRIIDFKRQVPFPIHINKILICRYYADFAVYYPNGKVNIIDVKGFKTDVYKLKKKMVKAQYGIIIIEK